MRSCSCSVGAFDDDEFVRIDGVLHHRYPALHRVSDGLVVEVPEGFDLNAAVASMTVAAVDTPTAEIVATAEPSTGETSAGQLGWPPPSSDAMPGPYGVR